MHAIVNIALKAARDASEVLAHNSDRLDRVRVLEPDGDGSITNMHIDSEKTIIFHLQKAYPEYGVQSAVSGIIEGSDPDNVWIIDPLCGANNYMRGLGQFGVSIALATAGRVNHCVLVNPMLREEFTASRGAGAQVNSQKLRVSNRKTLAGGTAILETQPGNSAHNAIVSAMTPALLELGCDIRLGASPALDLAYVAAGRYDAAWVSNEASESMAAALLLLQESGALISDAKGNPVLAGSKELVTGNAKCFKQLLQSRQSAS
ncbi:MAG: inositol monophosphatase family protein [Pseudohongiellaceae bacterium]|nr:inositol monophosphatase family protein [Pseudohongiellaceae bacterium]